MTDWEKAYGISQHISILIIEDTQLKEYTLMEKSNCTLNSILDTVAWSLQMKS